VEPLDGIPKIERSESDKFTAKQIKMIRNMRSGQRVYMEDIQAIGPDGAIRYLNVIFLKIK